MDAQQAWVPVNTFPDNTNQRIRIQLNIQNNINSAATCKLAAIRTGYQFNETIFINYAGLKSCFYNESNQANNFNTPVYGFSIPNLFAGHITSINQNITDAQKEIAVLAQSSDSGSFQPCDESGNSNGSNINPIPINDKTVNFFNPLEDIFEANTVLPTLLDRKDHVLVQWEAVNNEQVDYYEIERSEGEGIFKTIGIIMSDGNTATTAYSFKDKVTTRDLQLYYRIRVINTDRTFHYSSTATIKLSSVQKQIVNVFPNPAAKSIRIELPEQTGTYVCRIYNSSGSIMLTANISTENPFIAISKLTIGTYFMELYQPQTGMKYYTQFSKQ